MVAGMKKHWFLSKQNVFGWGANFIFILLATLIKKINKKSFGPTLFCQNYPENPLVKTYIVCV